MNFEIQQGIPLPAVALGRRKAYPFHKMVVGDSFDIPDDLRYQRVRYAVRYANKQGDEQFCVRRVDATEDEVYARCWRIE